VPLTEAVSFKARLQRGNRVQVPSAGDSSLKPAKF
jgi:hypothetical protein